MSLYSKIFGRMKETATTVRLKATLAALDLVRGVSQGPVPTDTLDIGAKVAKTVMDGLGEMGEVGDAAPDETALERECAREIAALEAGIADVVLQFGADRERHSRRIDELLASNTALLFKLRATDRKTMVREFHAKFDCPIGERPHVPADARVRSRSRLVAEEFIEGMEATYGDSKEELWRLRTMKEAIMWVVEHCPVKVNLPELCDAWVDLPWVCEGGLVEFGVDSTPLWAEVAKTNMAKDGGGRRGDGKIKKPEGWLAPDMKGLLTAQGWDGKDGIKR